MARSRARSKSCGNGRKCWAHLTALSLVLLTLTPSLGWSTEEQCLHLFRGSSLDSRHQPIVLNFGGEGEIPDAYNINSLIGSTRNPMTIPDLIQADMRATPMADASVDAVICNKCPSQGKFRFEVTTEAFRVLKSGGQISLWSMTGGGQLWMEPLTTAGFINVRIVNGRARAEKP